MERIKNLLNASPEIKFEVTEFLSGIIYIAEYEGAMSDRLKPYCDIVVALGGKNPLSYEEEVTEPVFQHDCEKCTFLETIEVGVNKYDVYANCNEKGFVFRFSSAGPDYISGTKEACWMNAEANKDIKLNTEE